MATRAHSTSLRAILLQDHWAITKEAKRAIVNPLLLGDSTAELDEDKVSGEFLAGERAPHFITPNGDTIQLADATAQEKVVVGSVGVVPLKGVLVKECPAWAEKYWGLCSAERFSADVLRMAADARVKRIVIPTDGPGGQAAGIEKAHNAILQAKASKEVDGHVENVCASAHYFILSACSRIHVSGKTDVLGSLGLVCTIWDDSKFMADIGIDEIDVYADQSTRKNEEVRAALGSEKDFSKLKRSLSERCAMFLGMAQGGRPKLSAEALTGAVFLADAAIANGLADSITPLDAVITMALSAEAKTTTVEVVVSPAHPSAHANTPSAVVGSPLPVAGLPTPAATTQPDNRQPTTDNQPAPMNKFTALLATIATFGKELTGLDGPITAEQVTEANSALAREGVKGVELVDTASLKALRDAQTAAATEATTRDAAAKARVKDISALLKSHAQPELAAEATEADAYAALLAHATALGSTAPAVPHTGAAAPAAPPQAAKYTGHDEALKQLNGGGDHAVRVEMP